LEARNHTVGNPPPPAGPTPSPTYPLLHLSILSQGTYAKVRYAQHSITGEVCAVKILEKQSLINHGMVEQIKREIAILKAIHHPHIVNLKEVLTSKEKIYMVMELVTGGELFDKIALEGPMKENQARLVFAQLLDAVEYCHSKGVYHRDIKPENVLLASSGSVKLSDFGLGIMVTEAMLGQKGILNTTCGTPNYVAPEVIDKKGGYDGGPADVWSLGVCLYVILSGCLPFDEEDFPTLFAKIKAAEYAMPPWLSPNARDIIRCMIKVDPGKRWGIGSLWEHPWMVEGNVHFQHNSGSESVLRNANGDDDGDGGSFEERVDALAMDVFKETDDDDDEVSDDLRTSTKKALLGSTSQRRAPPHKQNSARKLNLFDLINKQLDISAILHTREERVSRFTRFTTDRPLADVLAQLENAAVATGGRVEYQDYNSSFGDNNNNNAQQEEKEKESPAIKIFIPHPQGTIKVLVEVCQVLGTRLIVDVSKIKGNTTAFYRWYAELVKAIGPIIIKKDSYYTNKGGEGGNQNRENDGGAHTTPQSHDADSQSTFSAAAGGGGGGRGRQPNAFELISGGLLFNLGAIFQSTNDAVKETSCQAQFTSRCTPAAIMAAVESGTVQLGGTLECVNTDDTNGTSDGGYIKEKRVVRVAVTGERVIVVNVGIQEILPGLYLTRLEKEEGSSIDFYKFYAKLAKTLQGSVVKKVAHPAPAAGMLGGSGMGWDDAKEGGGI
jgi:serine/threonine protein kinase